MALIRKTSTGSVLLAVALLGGAPAAFGQRATEPTPADNTRVNKQDRSGVTADKQKENRSDRELTRQIRRAITKDKSLSSYARNVKVVAQEGKVTLKGPVRTEEEKKVIEARAVEVAGQGNVENQIRIAPKRNK